MRVCIFITLTFGLWANSGQLGATQPAATPAAADPAAATATVDPVVELERLAELGRAVAAIRYDSDNAFVYAQRSLELRKAAQALEGGQLEFVAKVMRVTETEVIVKVTPVGKTRLILMHAVSPTYGNLRTVRYHGVPSTQRLHLFSAPVGLRIGSEVDPERAKKLRHRDTLVLRGKIASLPVWIESVFAPDVVALISDWRLIDVNPRPGY